VVDYLATADRAVRALVRWRQAVGVPSADPDDLATEAVAAFEELRERSQVISLLTGDREDPVRRASREMREPLLPLLPLRDEVLGAIASTTRRCSP
jgi:cation transport ATPase